MNVEEFKEESKGKWQINQLRTWDLQFRTHKES